ncbi:MAG: hypothetical protein GXO26_06050 [Crenarchaeota archaeon]|nr:hypothetical protein [Thermoproteota archaeon]
MTIKEVANRYFTKDDPIKTVASYIALLVLRFERRSNYEKIINVEEIIRPLKPEINILLGPSASFKAYETAIMFIEELFKTDPEILEAEKRFKKLEEIECEKYSIIRRHYLTIVENSINELRDPIKFTLFKILNDLRYGKVHLIDRTCAGSCYISKIDLLSRYLENNINLINEFSENLIKVGILKSNYLRIIVPAPILEESFIKKIIRREDRELISNLDSALMMLGFYKEKIESIEEFRIINYVKNIEGSIKFRLRIITTDKVSKSIEKILNTKGNVFNIILTRMIESEKLKRDLEDSGIPVIVYENFNSKYIIDKIVKIILELSSTTYLKNVKELLEDVLEILM